jgi:hypothetical protein
MLVFEIRRLPLRGQSITRPALALTDGPCQFRARIGFAGFSGIAPQETLFGCMRGFRSILRNLRKSRDWLVEQKGFEPSTPTLRT